MMTSALIAGFVAGLLAALLHFAFVQQLILLGEKYETGEVVHFQGASAAMADHDHGDHDHAAPEAHSHEHGAAESGASRDLLTSLFYGLTYVSFALLLVAGFGLAESFGKVIGLREGLLWGIAGFVTLQLAPAMGLAPELPGTLAADLGDRQIWWVLTVASTASGLALLAYGKTPVLLALGVVAILLPHLVGAPELESYSGVAPPELASAFAVRSLGVGLAAWAVLGALAGRLWQNQNI